MVFPLSRLAASMRAMGCDSATEHTGNEGKKVMRTLLIGIAPWLAVLFRPCAEDEGRDDRRCKRPQRLMARRRSPPRARVPRLMDSFDGILRAQDLNVHRVCPWRES